MEIAVAGFPETLVGFRLAGLAIASECTRDDADVQVNMLMDNASVGLVVLDQDLVPLLSPKTRKKMEASTKPVVIMIPGKSGAVQAGAESISMMVKRAIGIELTSK